MAPWEMRKTIADLDVMHERLRPLADAPEVERARLYIEQAAQDLGGLMQRRDREAHPVVPFMAGARS